ncbi:MAG: biopolymer transporter ExbD [Deltaproteobacteria bacterium]|jgi:biopolymer transport protein TolR|nr:biopolymer transporter ExbD [Deltaproteobacteria bacterium]
MSVVVDTGGNKGGKKPLNSELNLVPYIDMLTVLVAFLLITAVWTQLARLQAQQKGQGQAGEETPPEMMVKVVVLVNQEGFNLVVGQDQTPIPKKGADYDFERLATELKKAKDAHPDKNDAQVASEDTIKFDTLVHTMDIALEQRFPDISLIDTGAAGI